MENWEIDKWRILDNLKKWKIETWENQTKCKIVNHGKGPDKFYPFFNGRGR